MQMDVTFEDGHIQGRERSLRTNPACRLPDLRLPASRTREHTFLLLKPLVCAAVLWQPQKTSTECDMETFAPTGFLQRAVEPSSRPGATCPGTAKIWWSLRGAGVWKALAS